MGKYITKSNIAGDVSVKDIPHRASIGLRTRAATLHRLRSHSTSPSDESESFRYLQLRSRRLLKKLPSLADTKKQQKQRRDPRAKSVGEEDLWSACNSGKNDFDFDSEHTEAKESVPCSGEIDDFFAYAEQQQKSFFMEKYNFDIVLENPLQGRYEWVKVMP